MASAICLGCRILLIEANSSYFSDLTIAVDAAASHGAIAISNSYGGSEFQMGASETQLDVHYNHPKIAITASTGDFGYEVEYPAASRYVTAVGGTTLNQPDGNGSRELTTTE